MQRESRAMLGMEGKERVVAVCFDLVSLSLLMLVAVVQLNISLYQ